MFDFGKTLTLQGLLAVVIAMLLLSPALANPYPPPPNDPSHYYSDQIVFDPTDPVWDGTDWFAVAEHYNKGGRDINEIIAMPNGVFIPLLLLALGALNTEAIQDIEEAIETGWIGLHPKNWGDKPKFEAWVTNWNHQVDDSECGGTSSYGYGECVGLKWKEFVQAFVKESNKCGKYTSSIGVSSFDAIDRTTWKCKAWRRRSYQTKFYWDASSYISNLPPRSGGSGGGLYR